ncbi:hypothetical protein [Frigoriglobus tundricola]|uniref:hypothetical protein n=1 Tax=Frigoriglobus tundricola TaxID=2774151 RepID=UPI00148EEC89|nr:hypothetical protein [Frigoriglobus tundricola]
MRPPLKTHTTSTATASNNKSQSSSLEFRTYLTGENVLFLEGSGTKQPESARSGASVVSVVKEKGEHVVTGMGSQASTVSGRNSRYTFRLTQAKKGDGWLLANIGKVGAPEVEQVDNYLNLYRDQALQFVDQVQSLDGMMKLSTFFESDRFKLISATRPNPTGPVTIHFTRPYHGAPDLTIECRYTFDPASRWLPVEWVESVTSPDGTRSQRVNRKIVSSEHKFETETTIVDTSNRPEPRTTTYKSRYTVETDNDLDQARFTLPAYGLPEPPGFAPAKTPWFVWLLVTAATCLCLAVGFRLLGRRLAKYS